MIFPDDLEQWRRAMAELHAATVPDQDSRAAVEAAAALWSRCAANSAPPPVAELLLNAMEIGYAAAGRPPRQRLRRSAAGLAPHPGGTLSQPPSLADHPGRAAGARCGRLAYASQSRQAAAAATKFGK